MDDRSLRGWTRRPLQFCTRRRARRRRRHSMAAGVRRGPSEPVEGRPPRRTPSENPLGERRSVPHNSRTVCSCRGRAMRVSPRNPTCEPLAQSLEHLPFKVGRWGDGGKRSDTLCVRTVAAARTSGQLRGQGARHGNSPLQGVATRRLHSKGGSAPERKLRDQVTTERREGATSQAGRVRERTRTVSCDA